MSKVNSLVLCRDNYQSKEEFRNAIQDAVMLLLNAGYIMVIKYDDPSFEIVEIEYNYDDESYGDRYPRWLFPEEEESVVYSEN